VEAAPITESTVPYTVVSVDPLVDPAVVGDPAAFD